VFISSSLLQEAKAAKAKTDKKVIFILYSFIIVFLFKIIVVIVLRL
jgi:hypothetical protein